MNTVTTINDWRQIYKKLDTQKIGFVPTMGHLHQGHLALVKLALEENDLVVVSIFVNPTQFNQANDFKYYPRTLEDDIQQLIHAQVNYLFLPNTQELYADQFEMQLQEINIAQELEGKYRPGHFTGMLTIVMKLLNIVQPQRAYFGEKDYQQYLLVDKMVRSFFMPLEIRMGKTIRAADGLALSSRNSRLTELQRKKAANFPRLLGSNVSINLIKEELLQLGFKIDYIEEKWGRRLGAVWLDDIRLIDNFNITALNS